MARKGMTVKQVVSAQEEEARLLAEIRGEIANEAYDAQEVSTQDAIDVIVARLGVNENMDDPYVVFNLLFVAVEIAKNLAVTGIRLASYTFPDNQCVSCGGAL